MKGNGKRVWLTNETERQELIAELLRLRALGMNQDRQATLRLELAKFEYGWPVG